MTTKIGNRDVLAQFTLIVPENEDAWVEFDAGPTWHVKLNVRFVDDVKQADGKLSLTHDAEKDFATLTFFNWDKPLATSTAAPFQIGFTEQQKAVSCMFSGHAVQKTRVVHLVFLLEV